MIVVTGGLGFIGCNVVRALNKQGRKDIVIVDDLSNGRKFLNVADCDFEDILDFRQLSEDCSEFKNCTAVIHMGACSSTQVWDGHLIIEKNYEFSKKILSFCNKNNAQLIYASSASVYGNGKNGFKEERSNENPINAYAFSKFQFDQYIRLHKTEMKTDIVGLRFFNVYGPYECHKGGMASVFYHFYNQIKETGTCKLFGANKTCEAGEQKRDFVFVGDVVNVILWLLEDRNVNGIFNVGAGEAQTFNTVANALLNAIQTGKVEYIDFPEQLEKSYQNFTQADISNLKEAGYNKPMTLIEEGAKHYVKWMDQNEELGQLFKDKGK